jgi:hypothetical protein
MELPEFGAPIAKFAPAVFGLCGIETEFFCAPFIYANMCEPSQVIVSIVQVFKGGNEVCATVQLAGEPSTGKYVTPPL